MVAPIFKISLGRIVSDPKIIHINRDEWVILHYLVSMGLFAEEDMKEYTFVYDGLYGIETCETCDYEHLKLIELC